MKCFEALSVDLQIALNREVIGRLRERLKTLPINDNDVPRALVFESNM